MSCNRTGWIGSYCCHSVSTTAWTDRSRFEVSRGSDEVGHCTGITSILSLVHSPLLFSGVNLLQVGDTSVSSAAFSSLYEVWNCDGHQDTDDQDDDHDFDERESSISLHCALHSFSCFLVCSQESPYQLSDSTNLFLTLMRKTLGFPVFPSPLDLT